MKKAQLSKPGKGGRGDSVGWLPILEHEEQGIQPTNQPNGSDAGARFQALIDELVGYGFSDPYQIVEKYGQRNVDDVLRDLCFRLVNDPPARRLQNPTGWFMWRLGKLKEWETAKDMLRKAY